MRIVFLIMFLAINISGVHECCFKPKNINGTLIYYDDRFLFYPNESIENVDDFIGLAETVGCQLKSISLKEFYDKADRMKLIESSEETVGNLFVSNANICFDGKKNTDLADTLKLGYYYGKNYLEFKCDKILFDVTIRLENTDIGKKSDEIFNELETTPPGTFK